MNYTEYVDTMVVMLGVQSSAQPAFVTYLPRMIEYAENRIHRDTDFLHSMKYSASANMTPGTRTVTVPGDILIVQSVNVVTPANTAAAAGTRNPLQRVSNEMLNFVAPITATAGVPLYYAMSDETTIEVGPTPDAAYKLDVYGQYSPTSLSIATPTTYLSTEFPELMIAASLIFGFGEQQNFGAMSDNPQAAQSWENQYQLLLKSIEVTEDRKKATSAAWQAMAPAPMAKDPRTQ